MNPRVGMVATVRNRRGIIASVEEYLNPVEGVLHAVRIEYSDYEGLPEDVIIWEREINAGILEPLQHPGPFAHLVGNRPHEILNDFDLVRHTDLLI